MPKRYRLQLLPHFEKDIFCSTRFGLIFQGLEGHVCSALANAVGCGKALRAAER